MLIASTDGGATWNQVGAPWPDGAPVNSMAFDATSSTLYLATRGSGNLQIVP